MTDDMNRRETLYVVGVDAGGTRTRAVLAPSAGGAPLGEGGGNLQEALGPDEVVAEVGAQRVSVPGGPRNLPPPLAKKSVVHEGHQRLLLGQLLHHGPACNGEQAPDVEPCPGEQAVCCGPVDELLPTSAQQAGDGMAAKGDQSRDGQGERALVGAVLGKRRPGLGPELAKTAE